MTARGGAARATSCRASTCPDKRSDSADGRLRDERSSSNSGVSLETADPLAFMAKQKSAPRGVAAVCARLRSRSARETWLMEEWALAVIAGTLLAYSALQAWRPGVVPPAIVVGRLPRATGLKVANCQPFAARRPPVGRHPTAMSE